MKRNSFSLPPLTPPNFLLQSSAHSFSSFDLSTPSSTISNETGSAADTKFKTAPLGTTNRSQYLNRKVTLEPLTPKTKWSAKEDPKVIADRIRSAGGKISSKTCDQHLKQSRPPSVSDDILDSFVDCYSSISNQNSIEIEEMNNAASLESRCESDEKEQVAPRPISTQLSAALRDYYISLLIVDKYHNEATNKKNDSKSYGALIVNCLERKFQLLPETDFHRVTEETLHSLMTAREFNRAKKYIIDTVKTIPQNWLNEKLLESFHDCVFWLDLFFCLDLIERRDQIGAMRLLRESLLPHVELSRKGFIEQQELDYHFYLRKVINELSGVFSRAFPEANMEDVTFFDIPTLYAHESLFTRFEWDNQITQFWSNSYYDFFEKFGFALDERISMRPSAYRPYTALIATFFIGRMKALSSNSQLHYICKLPSSFQYLIENIVPKESAPSPVKSGSSLETAPSFSSAKSHLSISQTEYRECSSEILSMIGDNSRSSHVLKLANSICSQELVDVIESMDVKLLSADTNSYIVAASYRNKKMISLWEWHLSNQTAKQVLSLHHATKKPVQFLQFHKEKTILLYAEYNSIIVFDYFSKKIVAKSSDVHRNIVLQCEILYDHDSPPQNRLSIGNKTRARQYSNNLITLASLGFDYSFKITALSDSETDVPIWSCLDQTHCSASQVFTSFTLRRTNENSVEVILAMERGQFRVFRLRQGWTMHHVKTITLETLRISSPITRMITCPTNPDTLAITCQSDNRIILIDLSTQTIIRQLTSRQLQLEKRSDLNFSPCGNVLIVGSAGVIPTPPPVSQKSTAIRRPPSRTSAKLFNGNSNRISSSENVIAWSVKDGKLLSTQNISWNPPANRCQWISNEWILCSTGQRLEIAPIVELSNNNG